MADTIMLHTAVLTFHMAHNYGAMLQAFALETAVNNLENIQCEILDYRFPYIDAWNGVQTGRELLKRDGMLMGALRFAYRKLRGYDKRITPMQRKFDSFMRQEMRLSPKTYFRADALQAASYDAVIFGSDQIWNPALTNGFAPEYMGKFFDANKTRLISYAASTGTERLPEADCVNMLPLLRRFSALGVRERSLQEFLESQFGLPAKTVLDPVFLLSPVEWNVLTSQTERMVEKPYLLLYAFETGEDIYRLARRIAAERKLQLVSLEYQKRESLDEVQQLTDCGPKDFLSLVQNADFVCTSSFHGMAFSILFGKSFYCMGHPKYSERNRDLLARLSLDERLFFSDSEIKKITDCDYGNTDKLLSEAVAQSKLFLYESLL